MSGRGRARPPSRSAPEPAGGPSRRSTRHQQQQQDTAQPGEEQPEIDSPEQQVQDQANGQQAQDEAAMPAPVYHQNIDPAIAGPQDGGMPPPPVPSAKGLRGQAGPHVARRGTRRNDRASSMASINSLAVTDAFSSQPEPQSTAPQNATPARVFGTPARGSSIVSSQADDTPSRNAARARLMNSMLPRLLTASDDFFTQLCSDQVDPEMWETERKGFKVAFDAYRGHYVPHPSDPVVNPAFVADTMRLDRATAQCDRVFRIVSAANLVSLLDEITPIDQHELLLLLQDWNSGFPDFYLGASSDNNDNEMKAQVIEHVLMIRTQLTIFTLQKFKDSPEPFHPFEQVAKIWCDGDVSVEAVEAFLGNNEDALQLKPIARAAPEASDLAGDRIATRLVSICSMLPNQLVQGDSLDLSQLHETYQVEVFVDDLRTFVKSCFARIRALLQQGSSVGRDALLALAASDAASRADSQIRSQLDADSMAHSFDRAESGAAPATYNMSSMHMLKELAQQAPGVYGDSNQLPPGSYAPAPRIPYPPGFNSSPIPADHAQQGGFPSSGFMYAESAAQAAQGPGRKRRAQAEPAQGGEEAPGSTTKKQRVRRKKNEPAAMAPASTATPASASLAVAVAQSQYPPLPGTQDEPDLEALSQRTKEISAAARKVKEPQVRSAWVRKDVTLLIKAVNTYQCKWSTIEKEIKAGTIPFERPRDQQALRDKARLLKQDFLKADAVLPRGFDLVVLGKKEREAVKAVGKNPDRREGDLDENGQPVNTELAPEGMAAPVPPPAPLPPVEPQPEQQLHDLPEPQPAIPEPPAA